MRKGMTVSAEPLKPVTLNERETYLLEALEGLLDALPSATTRPAIQAAHAAIAKAKGEQP